MVPNWFEDGETESFQANDNEEQNEEKYAQYTVFEYHSLSVYVDSICYNTLALKEWCNCKQ